MSDVQNLYHELILDHNKNPFHFSKPEKWTHYQEGFNPVCGDHYHIYLNVNDQTQEIENVYFTGSGCAISKACASMMAQILDKKSTEQADKIIVEFQNLITHQAYDEKLLGKLKVFSQVWNYPARVKCALLAWHTLKTALNDNGNQEGSHGN